MISKTHKTKISLKVRHVHNITRHIATKYLITYGAGIVDDGAAGLGVGGPVLRVGQEASGVDGGDHGGLDPAGTGLGLDRPLGSALERVDDGRREVRGVGTRDGGLDKNGILLVDRAGHAALHKPQRSTHQQQQQQMRCEKEPERGAHVATALRATANQDLLQHGKTYEYSGESDESNGHEGKEERADSGHGKDVWRCGARAVEEGSNNDN